MTTPSKIQTPKYRTGVVAITVNRSGEFLLLQLQSYGNNQWNFVGGGREKGETKLENLQRELKEELGLDKDCFKILGEFPIPLKYNYPPNIQKRKKLENRPWRGQIKNQFVIQITCNKNKIKLQEEEVRDIKWVKYKDLRSHLVFPKQFDNAVKVIEEILPELVEN